MSMIRESSPLDPLISTLGNDSTVVFIGIGASLFMRSWYPILIAFGISALGIGKGGLNPAVLNVLPMYTQTNYGPMPYDPNHKYTQQEFDNYIGMYAGDKSILIQYAKEVGIQQTMKEVLTPMEAL